MRFIRNSFLLFLSIHFCSLLASGQHAQINHPFNALFQQGVQDLKQGDTIAAFQHIQSAYTFSSKRDDISYYYFSLLLILDKPNAANAAIQ